MFSISDVIFVIYQVVKKVHLIQNEQSFRLPKEKTPLFITFNRQLSQHDPAVEV